MLYMFEEIHARAQQMRHKALRRFFKLAVSALARGLSRLTRMATAGSNASSDRRTSMR